MNIIPKTLKGFRDFLPAEAKKRDLVTQKLKEVFEYFDFLPIETPTLEYEEILLGKYGDEGDKLMYRFTDNGDRRVAMRYDQTVPLARFIAENWNNIPIPFMRYQISNVFRADNTQKGRFREFLQCDADIVGTGSERADVQVLSTAAAGLQAVQLKNVKILINDRGVFEGLSKETIIAIDKLKKIGETGVISEIAEKNQISIEDASLILEKVKNSKPTTRIQKILDSLKLLNYEGIKFIFSPTLARGLDYYTSTIFEFEVEGYTAGSIGGGGRYDNLIGMFMNNSVPAVGFSYGFDRLIEVLAEQNSPVFNELRPGSNLLIAITGPNQEDTAMSIANALRDKKIKVELYLGESTELGKQAKYAETKRIKYLLIIDSNKLDGPYELRYKEGNGEIIKKQVFLEDIPTEVIS